MEATIMAGEWLWIDKCAYGARLPKRLAEIPLLNVFTWNKLLREADMMCNWGNHRFIGYSSPEVGDIIVFNKPLSYNTLLVKRLVAKSGDTLSIISGNLIINGEIKRFCKSDTCDLSLKDTLAPFPYRKKWTIQNYGPLVIPEKRYFVLGDNRSNSVDSRFFGFITKEDIIGKIHR